MEASPLHVTLFQHLVNQALLSQPALATSGWRWQREGARLALEASAHDGGTALAQPPPMNTMANTSAPPLTLSVLAAALVTLAHASSAAAASSGKGPSMICVVEGMGSRVSEGTLCSRLERSLGVTMVLRDDPWARDAGGTVRVVGGDVDVLVAVAWRRQRVAWARRSWMELGSNYVSILGMTVHELLPLPIVKRLQRAQRAKGGGYRRPSIVRSEVIDPWVLSRMPVGAGLLPWEQQSRRRASK